MAIFNTKYSIGDVVFYAGTVVRQKQHPCPDCLGEGEWKATSPAGAEHPFPCPRCSTHYVSSRDLSLKYPSHEPHVQRLTIGSIRAHQGSRDEGTEYMCHETGIGSGSIYSEGKLYEAEEDALEAARILANYLNEQPGHVLEAYKGSLSVSTYQFKDAEIKSAQNSERQIRYKMDDLIGDIRNCESLEEVMELLDEKVGEAA